jgi:hypothetical protein
MAIEIDVYLSKMSSHSSAITLLKYSIFDLWRCLKLSGLTLLTTNYYFNPHSSTAFPDLSSNCKPREQMIKAAMFFCQ